jgi:DNA-directed RNA polymerase subunit RPC12/RpoP
MTDVVVYRCKACKKEFGPLGLHGYMPAEGNGELLVVCPKCKQIFVGTIHERKIENSNCAKCKTPLKLFNGKCPYCQSKDVIFYDIHFPQLENKASAAKL